MALVGVETIVLLALVTAVFLFGGNKVVDWARALGEARKAYVEAAATKEPEKKL